MEKEIFRAGNYTAKVVRCNTAIVGSGAAGFNAADRLWQLGQRDIVLVTENRVGGTSRNTGSDKQTYYKLTLSGGEPDSVREMADTLYAGRCVDGDIALCEAALSTQCFLKLVELGVPFLSNSDSEVATKLIGYFTQRTGHLREGIRKTMELVRGGYAMTLINEQALYAFRDPHGIRPLVLGKLVDEGLDQADAAAVSQLPSQDGAATVDSAVRVTRAGGWVVASETCALDIVGAEYVRDVRPGEILRISAEGLVSEQGVPAAEEPANCIFEQVYFARPDSIMNGKSVYACRYDMGRQLAHEEPVEADLVIGVPDSGLPPAEGYSHESGIPFGEGLIKNRYVGRTFIEPTQELRAMGVRMKLNPLRDNIEGKRLVVIDDSIVRGTTMVQLVKMLRNAGAKEIHIRINSPEVIWPCFYGIDTDVQSQLISANKTVDEICEYIGADSLAFLSVEGLLKVMPKGGYCDACFTGRYPVAIPESFGRDKFMEGFKPRNLDKPLHFDDDAVIEKYDDRSWEEEHGEA